MKEELSLGAQTLEYYDFAISKRDRQESFKKCNLDKLQGKSVSENEIASYEDLLK